MRLLVGPPVRLSLTQSAAVLGGALTVGSVPLALMESVLAPFVMLGGLAALLIRSRTAFVLGAVFGVPASTIAWDLELAQIAGRTFDARLAVTFGVAVVIGFGLLAYRPRLGRIDQLMFVFVALIAAVGVARSDSLLTWAPPAVRWFTYAGMFALARSSFRTTNELRWLAGAIVAGFAVPAVLGLLQFVVGESSFMNGAVRATAPGGRGPIGLAFAGQTMLLISYSMLTIPSERRAVWISAGTVGLLGILASATRLVSFTTMAALVALEAVRRRWIVIGVIVALFIASLVVRPDLLSRYFETVVTPSPPAVIGGNDSPSTTPPVDEPQEFQFDSSVQFRIFVWHVMLAEWAAEPLLGMGPGMTAPAVAAVSGAQRTAPHNDYLGVLAELGAVGLLLFVAIQAAIVAALLRAKRMAATDADRRFALGVTALFVATNVLAALDNPMYFLDVQVALWSLMGATLAVAAAAPRPLDAS